MEKSGVSPYAHMNEGYAVIVRLTGEIDATEAILDYLRKRTELIYKNALQRYRFYVNLKSGKMNVIHGF